MIKTILLTGATDGIGFATAAKLVKLGHCVLIHGRSKSKLENTRKHLAKINKHAHIEIYVADLSVLEDVKIFAEQVIKNHKKLDIIINNAGVYVVGDNVSKDGLDTRFVVNTIAPYLLVRLLLPLLANSGRIINVSSAAQASFNPNDLTKVNNQPDDIVYAQSKLALTMWTINLFSLLNNKGIVIIAVNPGSMLGSKMVKEAYGVNGKDIQIGANILCDLALHDKYISASGQYFDNDLGGFNSPHPDIFDSQKNTKLIEILESIYDNVQTDL